MKTHWEATEWVILMKGHRYWIWTLTKMNSTMILSKCTPPESRFTKIFSKKKKRKLKTSPPLENIGNFTLLKFLIHRLWLGAIVKGSQSIIKKRSRKNSLMKQLCQKNQVWVANKVDTLWTVLTWQLLIRTWRTTFWTRMMKSRNPQIKVSNSILWGI